MYLERDGTLWKRCACGSDVNMTFSFSGEYFKHFYNPADGFAYRDYLRRMAGRSSENERKRLMILPAGTYHTLEFGAGNFGMAMFNASQGHDVTVVDLTPFETVPPEVRFINADACTYKSDRKYDFVITSFVLEHLQKPNDFLRVCAEALSDTGQLAISYAVNDSQETFLYGYESRYYRPDHAFMANRDATLAMLRRHFHVEGTWHQCSSIDLFGAYNGILQRLVCRPVELMKLSGRVIAWCRKLPGSVKL
jgi:SAM-dependent methyltransferase